MESVNMHEAKTRLSQLVAKTEKGEGFIIAKSGRPVARVSPIEAPDSSQQKRLGFLRGQFQVPEDFDRMGEDEISAMFGG